MSFHVGQQVVCVSNRFSTNEYWRQAVRVFPQLYSIYTIREIHEGFGSQQGLIGFCLYEIVNPIASFSRAGKTILLEPAFDSRHFRVAKCTSIEVFKKTLARKERIDVSLPRQNAACGSPTKIQSAGTVAAHTNPRNKTVSELSRRSLVAGAAALPVLAAPAVGTESVSAARDGDRPTMLARAHQIVELLRNNYISGGWSLDEQRAADFLESVRRVQVDEPDNGAERTILDWLHDHGQSLSWLITGETSGLIRSVAAATLGSMPADVCVTDRAYEITVELPGMDAKDIEVKVINSILTIKGEKRDEKAEKEKDYWRRERRFGRFERSFQVYDDVDSDKIEANFENAVLSVTLPKNAKAQKAEQKIEQKAAA
jgi:HSP20 family molecular chaperone IbpA